MFNFLITLVSRLNNNKLYPYKIWCCPLSLLENIQRLYYCPVWWQSLLGTEAMSSVILKISCSITFSLSLGGSEKNQAGGEGSFPVEEEEEIFWVFFWPEQKFTKINVFNPCSMENMQNCHFSMCYLICLYWSFKNCDCQWKNEVFFSWGSICNLFFKYFTDLSEYFFISPSNRCGKNT